MPPPPPLQHDYIGMAESPHAMGRRHGCGLDEEAGEGDNDYDGGLLRETELRLGPPGSRPPRRKDKPLSLELLPSHKGFASGAKRGFLEAIDGSGKWVFSGGVASETEAGKGAGLFSPRGDGAGRQSSGAKKEGGPASAGVALEKKGPVPSGGGDRGMAPAPKAQVVGWPPIRSYRKNTMAANPSKKGEGEDAEEKQDSSCLYVKVSMDGAPYLRKIDLKIYSNYKELSTALEKMFSCFTLGQYGSQGMPRRDGLNENKVNDLHRSEYVLTYEDKDGDWMLVGDVPWEMFTDSCRRLRIMKGSDAIGLAPRSTDKYKNRN